MQREKQKSLFKKENFEQTFSSSSSFWMTLTLSLEGFSMGSMIGYSK